MGALIRKIVAAASAAMGLAASAIAASPQPWPHSAADTREPIVIDALGWIEQKIVPDGAAALAAFGTTAIMRDGFAFVGAVSDTVDGNFGQGVVYVFTESDSGWRQSQRLTSSDGVGGDLFGATLAFDGTTLVIGAHAAALDNQAQRGAAYVFTQVDGNWIQQQKLTAADGLMLDNFGASVAIAGDTIVVGAQEATIGNAFAQGSAYVFKQANGTWSQTQKLIADDGGFSDLFGTWIALSGTHLLISADEATDDDGVPGLGAVYAFENDAGVWTQSQRIAGADSADGDYFGRWVALDGDQMLVGAPAANGFTGSAYAFAYANGSWAQTQELEAADGQPGDFYGDAGALHGTTAVIGAPGATIGGSGFVGAAYVWQQLGGTWSMSRKLQASDGVYGDEFGVAVALDASGRIIVGAPHPTDDGEDSTGMAYAYSNDAVFSDGFDGTSP